MASPPPAACNVNCGTVDTVSEFYRVFVPINEPQFFDYHHGVRYVFVRQDPTSCVWEREVEGDFGWDIERLSRYPLGWAFFGIEPVPGKWTWRLSIDRFPTTPSDLHGWLRQFDRVTGIPDPQHNCSISHRLESYVPFLGQPDATIVPVAEDDTVPPHIKQNTSPCFCESECPLSSRPHKKQIVTIPGSVALPDYALGKLYDFNVVSMGNCFWAPVEPTPGATVEAMGKTDEVPTTGDHAYRWSLRFVNVLGVTDTWTQVKEWNEDGDPNPILPAQCDLPSDMRTIVPSSQAIGRGVPEWVCDDAQARLWAAKYPLP